MSLPTRDLETRIGTAIALDADVLLSGRYAKDIRLLLEQRGVLVFPGVNLSDAQQVAFAETIGEVIPQGEKGILKITLDPSESAKADYLRSTIYWHFDGFSDDVPTLASMLSPRRLSATGGGDTEFANTYASFEALPERRREELLKLKVVHSVASIVRLSHPNPTREEEEAWAQSPGKVHPLVWTHRSGRKSLLIGSSASRVEGMDLEKGRGLLAELLEWATQPQFVYRHEWSMDDLVIWDNTGTLHRVVPYAVDSGRLMHRTTLFGEEAIA